jgi:putative transcriptional regulator
MKKESGSGKSGGGSYVRVKMTPERRRKALRSVDWKRINAMTDEEIERNALADPDSIVTLPANPSDVQFVPAMPDVAAMRRRMKLSQAQFAVRFGFSVATVRNWEQGRVLADGPARILLAVIEREPQVVIRALRPGASRADAASAKSRKKAGLSRAA